MDPRSGGIPDAEPPRPDERGDAANTFRDEALAPEVDRELLRALVRRELTAEAARNAYRLVHAFRSWNEAHAEVLAEEFRSHRPAEPPPEGGAE